MFNTKLAKWFAIWLLAMICLALIFQPESRPEKIDTVGFSTTDSDELYFKNMRLFYYSTKEEANGLLEVHRLNTITDAKEPILPFAIFHSWRQNQAFIRLDTSFIRLNQGAEIVKDSLGNILELGSLPDLDNESQYIFARDVYKTLRDNNSIGIRSEDKVVWYSESASRSIKQSLKDYFKLIGKL